MAAALNSRSSQISGYGGAGTIPPYFEAAAVAPTETPGSPRIFVGDRRRYLVLVAFAALGTSNGAQWITFSPIVDEVKAHFGVSAYQVNLLTSIYPFGYVAFVLLNCATFSKLGLRWGLVIAAALNALGAGWRILALLAAPNYAMLVISLLFCAVTQVLIISTPPLIAATWFLASERTVVTALASNFMNIGIAVGMVMPTLMVRPGHSGQDAFLGFFVAQTAWAGAALLLVLFGVPSQPRTPPSFAALASPLNSGGGGGASSNIYGGEKSPNDDALEQQPQPSLLSSLRELATNPSFMLLASLFTLALGVIWSLSAVLPQVLLPFGVSEVLTGWAGFGNMASGAVVATVIGHFVDKHKAFKGSLVALSLSFLVLLGVWALVLIFAPSGAVASSFVCYLAIGACVNTVLPVALELGVELTYPVPAEVSSTAMLWGASAASIVIVQVMSAILGNSPTRDEAARVLALSIGCVALGTLLLLPVVPVHKRVEFERASAAASSPTSSPA